MQVEICVEVVGQVERLVRCTDPRREDGEKQLEVLGTEHGSGPNWLGWSQRGKIQALRCGRRIMCGRFF